MERLRWPPPPSYTLTEIRADEANLPTQPPQACQEPRLPAPDVHQGRQGDPEGPAGQGKAAALGLSEALGRIRDRRTFEELSRSGRRVRRGPVTVTYADVGSSSVPRVAYAVGRRTGGAVQRNRVRRRLRAIVGGEVAGLAPGAYLIAVAPAAASMSFWELSRLVKECLRAIVEQLP